MAKLLFRQTQKQDTLASLHNTVLHLSWPWWLHPGTALLLLAGSMALVSIILPPDVYSMWRVQKYLDLEQSSLLIIGVIAMIIGIVVTTLRARRSATVALRLTAEQLHFLRKANSVLLLLTLLGYTFWIFNAMQQGVSFSDLARVLQRESSAIGELKRNIRPVAGMTTLTQFGPVAATVSVLLNRLDVRNRVFLVVIALAAFRAYFYAERLAIIEVLIPILVMYAVTVRSDSRRNSLVRWGPLLAMPLIWSIFAISEYSRSWVYYQQIVQGSFSEWVTTRLMGYYITSYNNSALFNLAWPEAGVAPYYSVVGFWNAPIVEGFLHHAGVNGIPIASWWSSTLINNANVEFTNNGSFLLTQAEFGTLGMVVIWTLAGMGLGAIYTSLRDGSVPSLVAYVVLFVGILELPRFIYWTNGRSFPVILAISAIAILFPREGKLPSRRLRGRRGAARRQVERTRLTSVRKSST